MLTPEDSIRSWRSAFESGSGDALNLALMAEAALNRANANPGRNTYHWQDRQWTLNEASQVQMQRPEQTPLKGIPVSIKDCFDLSGSPTSCGTFFYRDLHGKSTQDSWLVKRLRSAGAVITGKTHLQPLAYGLTGENRDFGDCLQPGEDDALTGGSSSGAAASVLEGSCLAAVGTDTGGSIRIPAALCGLVGYRASHGRGQWQGATHLAPSFDTFGWLFRHLQDAPLLASIFGPADASRLTPPKTFALVNPSFLDDCEPLIQLSYQRCAEELKTLGLRPRMIDVEWWREAPEIFAPIQAAEAAQIHAGHFHEFEPVIRQRLAWGASISADELASWRRRHACFRQKMDDLVAEHELLLWPAAPVSRLPAGMDHNPVRPRLLRYTTPVSLAGMPALTLPYFDHGRPAGAMQLVAAREDDSRLLALAVALSGLAGN
jgi:Asp-tRNA(Asn)/Glu-tRNA(Gln) amidotransferase A subunit family amidase